MNRREFLERMEGVSVGALAGGAGLSFTGCIGFHYVNTSLSGNRLTVRKSDFGSGRFALVDAPGLALPLYLYRLEDGEILRGVHSVHAPGLPGGARRRAPGLPLSSGASTATPARC